MKQVFDHLTPLQAREARRWLVLAVGAIALSGLFALLLVLSRAPGVSALFPWVDFFHTALVVHVNQSVLVWFMTMAALLVTLLPGQQDHPGMRIAFWMAALGTLGIAVSAFLGNAQPLMSNYIPVLQRWEFFVALGGVLGGVILRLLLTGGGLIAARGGDSTAQLHRVIVQTVLAGGLLSLAAGLWTYWRMPVALQGEDYFEYLFWGAGHVLQFAYAQMMILGWIWLAWASDVGALPKPGVWSRLALLVWLPLLCVPLIYLLYPAVSAEMRLAFTRLMQFGGGIPAIPIMLLLIYGLARSKSAAPDSRVLRLTLWMSLILFGAGGLIALLIRGVNTTIPAHYHGSTVGVTLALMGVAYLLLPHLGFRPVAGRLACAQPLLYGGGQLLHILGLASAGALGIQRKTAGAQQQLDSLAAKLTMGVMGVGGLLAVAGGVLFVWLMLRSFLQPANET